MGAGLRWALGAASAAHIHHLLSSFIMPVLQCSPAHLLTLVVAFRLATIICLVGSQLFVRSPLPWFGHNMMCDVSDRLRLPSPSSSSSAVKSQRQQQLVYGFIVFAIVERYMLMLTLCFNLYRGSIGIRPTSHSNTV